MLLISHCQVKRARASVFKVIQLAISEYHILDIFEGDVLLLVVMKDDDGNADDNICPEPYQPKNVWVSCGPPRSS